jgi:hypothetical protein
MADQPQVTDKETKTDREIKRAEEEMERTRGELTRKAEALEAKVVNTAEGVTEAVAETVETVKDAVTGTVENVKETVEAVKEKVSETVQEVGEALNPVRQTERRPWLMFGGAVTAGCLGAWLLSRRRRAAPPWSRLATPAWQAAERPPLPPQARPEEPKRASWLEEGWVGEELRKIKGLAVGTLLGAVRDLVSRVVPESIRDRLAEQVDSITSHLGGEPVRGPVLPEERQEEEGQEGGNLQSEAGQRQEEEQGRQGGDRHGRRAGSRRRAGSGHRR